MDQLCDRTVVFENQNMEVCLAGLEFEKGFFRRQILTDNGLSFVVFYGKADVVIAVADSHHNPDSASGHQTYP